MVRTPQAMTSELDISPATLRRWSDEFANYLSVEANSAQGRNHRRYTDNDLAILTLVKQLMNQGMTYEQVRQTLATSEGEAIWTDRVTRIPAQNDELEPSQLRPRSDPQEIGLIPMNGNDSPALEFITNTLTVLSENQKSVLNSQAANRELLGVLIQDNFNLKEENNRLRERIIDVERDMARIRQDEAWSRESLRQELDAKIMQAQRLATEAISTASAPQAPPEIKAVKTKPGCLGGLFGGGDIQIVSLPGRGRQKEQPPARPTAATNYPRPTAPPQPPAPAHPKPTLPPE